MHNVADLCNMRVRLQLIKCGKRGVQLVFILCVYLLCWMCVSNVFFVCIILLLVFLCNPFYPEFPYSSLTWLIIVHFVNWLIAISWFSHCSCRFTGSAHVIHYSRIFFLHTYKTLKHIGIFIDLFSFAFFLHYSWINYCVIILSDYSAWLFCVITEWLSSTNKDILCDLLVDLFCVNWLNYYSLCVRLIIIKVRVSNSIDRVSI